MASLGATKLRQAAGDRLHLTPFRSPQSSPLSVAKMNSKDETGELGEKNVNDGSPFAIDPETNTLATGQSVLHRDLKGRHMQMIAM